MPPLRASAYTVFQDLVSQGSSKRILLGYLSLSGGLLLGLQRFPGHDLLHLIINSTSIKLIATIVTVEVLVTSNLYDGGCGGVG